MSLYSIVPCLSCTSKECTEFRSPVQFRLYADIQKVSSREPTNKNSKNSKISTNSAKAGILFFWNIILLSLFFFVFIPVKSTHSYAISFIKYTPEKIECHYIKCCLRNDFAPLAIIPLWCSKAPMTVLLFTATLWKKHSYSQFIAMALEIQS